MSSSAIFQAGSLLVMIAESRTRAFLASVVPVIVNTVLNEHQLVLDIVAFVSKGDFPRSRLGEKQRGKILASWISRKMQTIAQFSIRDPDAEGSVGTAVPEEHAMARRRSSQQSLSARASSTFMKASPGMHKTPGTAHSSLRHVESVTSMPVAEEPLREDMATTDINDFEPPPGFEDRDNDTPTNERPYFALHMNNPDHESPEHSPISNDEYDTAHGSYDRPTNHGYEKSPSRGYERSPNEVYRKPSYEGTGWGRSSYEGSEYGRAVSLGIDTNVGRPQTTGGTTLDYLNYDPASPQAWNGGGEGRGGGLRIANRTSEESEDWSAGALRQLNLDR